MTPSEFICLNQSVQREDPEPICKMGMEVAFVRNRSTVLLLRSDIKKFNTPERFSAENGMEICSVIDFSCRHLNRKNYFEAQILGPKCRSGTQRKKKAP